MALVPIGGSKNFSTWIVYRMVLYGLHKVFMYTETCFLMAAGETLIPVAQVQLFFKLHCMVLRKQE